MSWDSDCVQQPRPPRANLQSSPSTLANSPRRLDVWETTGNHCAETCLPKAACGSNQVCCRISGVSRVPTRFTVSQDLQSASHGSFSKIIIIIMILQIDPHDRVSLDVDYATTCGGAAGCWVVVHIGLLPLRWLSFTAAHQGKACDRIHSRNDFINASQQTFSSTDY